MRVIDLPISSGGILFGGDYNPEQWPRSVWDEDVSLMRAAGVNLVTVGVFAWATLEPEDGRFEFEWLDEVLNLLAENAISVDLATPSASPPPWMAHDHPDSLMVDHDGIRMSTGARAHYCPTSPIYRDRSLRIARELGMRYRDHPALAMWHVNNEYHSTCYCRTCDEAFRRWLVERHGSLDELNDRWGTMVWGQRYSSWDQVHLPRPVRGKTNPARLLDFARFTSHVQLEVFRAERDELRGHTPTIPITTNFFHSASVLDYHQWAAEVDIVTYDAYPDPADPDAMAKAAMGYDLMRSVGRGKPWLLLEQATGAVSQWPINVNKKPGRMRAGSYQAVAHGSDSVMFFQWRAAPTGQEKFHSAILQHSGTRSRTWREVSELGQELPRIASIAGACTAAQVAVLWDWENWWAVEGPYHPDNGFSFKEALLAHYKPLWKRNVATDIVNLSSDLSQYRVLVVPNLYLITSAGREALTQYVKNGGQVLMSYFSGIVDEDDRVIAGGYPGGLHDLIGAHIEELSPMVPGSSAAVSVTNDHPLLPAGATGTATKWQDELVMDGATAVACYADGYLQGRPAVVDHRTGNGHVVYLGTRLDPVAMGKLTEGLLRRAGVQPSHITPVSGVEICERHNDDRTFTFVINHGERAAQVALTHGGIDLITAKEHNEGELVAVEPAGVMVLERNR